MIVGAMIAVILAGLGAWLIFRSRRAKTADPAPPARPKRSPDGPSNALPDAVRAGMANNLATDWPRN